MGTCDGEAEEKGGRLGNVESTFSVTEGRVLGTVIVDGICCCPSGVSLSGCDMAFGNGKQYKCNK